MSNESPKQTLLNDFSHRLKMEGEEQLFHCVNELKYGLSSNNEYDLFKNRETSLWKRKVLMNPLMIFIKIIKLR